MKDHATDRHPGPFRFMRVDSEFAGLLVAVGFLVMGFVSMPIATWFVVAAIALGVFVAVLLRFAPKKYARVAVGTVIILAASVLWWAGRNPRQGFVSMPITWFVVGANSKIFVREGPT